LIQSSSVVVRNDRPFVSRQDAAVIPATDAPAAVDYGRVLDRYAGVAFFAAPITSIREEGRGLFLRHWLEASASRLRPLSISWETYEAREQDGCIESVIARDMDHDGELIGYAVYLLYQHIHYATSVADSDAFFLARHKRRGWVAVRMLRAAEALLKERGVIEIWQRFLTDVRPGRGRSDLKPLFRYLGYRPVELAMRRRVV
jgi:GNAT superfamily N-acetyltransferase